MNERLGRAGVFALLGALAALVALNVPELGWGAWPFHPERVDPHGVLGPVVRAAHRRWDLGAIRTPGMIAGLLVAIGAAVALRGATWSRRFATALALVVVLLLIVPAVVLQVGLRDATAPWEFTNDSTYQIELGGDLVLDGKNPYGHDYRGSGLERFYPAAGVESEREQVALDHFAYFPGTPLSAAAWRALPSPLDDYRVLVLLATIALFFAVLLFEAPLEWRLPVAAIVAANPLAVRAAWFGTADAPSLLCVVLAFALVTRRRYVGAAAALAVAVLLKQFALVAVPFLVAALVARNVPRAVLRRAAAVFGAIVVAGILPFVVADPGALWRDTIAYGGETYRIIGYGLSSLLLRAGIVDRFGYYPFLPLVVLVWLPLTAWLVSTQLRTRALWVGLAGFSVSLFVLFFLSRVFQNSYLIWPLTGIAVAALAGSRERARAAA